jgi:site-specific recombinase XerD
VDSYKSLTVAKILDSVDNIKHKAILILVYSAGLRVREVVKLKPGDIDSKRMLIHIKGFSLERYLQS